MKKFILASLFLTLGIMLSGPVFGHPGNTDSYGCHTCRTNCPYWGLSYGEYHCHTPKIVCYAPSVSDCDVGATTAIQARRGLLGSDFGNAAIQTCQDQHDSYVQAQNEYNNCLNQSSNSPIIADTTQTGYKTPAQIDLEVKTAQDNVCIQFHGTGSHWDESLQADNTGFKCSESRSEAIDRIFNVHFKLAMDSLPSEYQDIVDSGVIKALSLDPINQDKTFSQVIKERYGSQVEAIINARNPVITATPADETVNIDDTSIIPIIPEKPAKVETKTPEKTNKIEDIITTTATTTKEIKTTESIYSTPTDQIVRYQGAKKLNWFQKLINFFINIFK